MLWPAQGFFRSPYNVEFRVTSLSPASKSLFQKPRRYLLASWKTGCSRGPQNEVRKSAQKPVALRGPPAFHCSPARKEGVHRARKRAWKADPCDSEQAGAHHRQ